MRKIIGTWMAVMLLSLFSLGALAAKPIYNLSNQPVSRADSKPLTAEQVRKAIVAAGAARGWVISPAGEGALTARLTVRKHVAEAHIEYSAAAFSIAYVSSTNLDYKKNRKGEEFIHRNYNRWINNLRVDTVNALMATTD